MKKLEIKHLSAYLAHDLKCFAIGEIVNETECSENPTPKTFLLHGLVNNKVSILGREKHMVELDEVFPILRPMSDLSKIINHKGEEFIPLGRLHYKYVLTASGKRNTKAKYSYHEENGIVGTWTGNGAEGRFGVSINLNNIFNCNYKMIQWLISWHFDVFGLINDEIAIDINTLSKKNYDKEN